MLIILAGVSIAMVVGENGIIPQAQNARRETEIANIKEKVQIDILEKELDNEGNIDKGEFIGILKEYFEGVPTIEMWVASYNAKGYTPLYTNTNTNGYYVGNKETPTTTFYDLSSDRGYNDTLYFPHQSAVDKCFRYWLASPSANFTKSLMRASCSGFMSYDSHDSKSGLGVRPVVSLNSEITATKDAEDIWRF